MTSEFTIAVHALVFLSHKGTYYSSEGLADNVCTNAARIRKVMAKLKKADLIKTKEGPMEDISSTERPGSGFADDSGRL